MFVFFSSIRRHTRCALVTGVRRVLFRSLMVGAQGYQESKLDQSARSKAGAIGIMQLLPSTAADPNVGIPDITTERNNIHAGVRYLRFLRDRYFSERSEARRVGKDCVSKSRSRWSPYN